MMIQYSKSVSMIHHINKLKKNHMIMSINTRYHLKILISIHDIKNCQKTENQDGTIGRHTAPPCTTRTDRKSNSKEVQHQGDKK